MRTPSARQYRAAFTALSDQITDNQRLMLRRHYHAPARTATARQLARAVGYGHYGAANGQYGPLALLVGDQLGYRPNKTRLGTLVTFEHRRGEWHWLMRPEVARALELLGWV
jgi:5-methylcytosine-specific restriction enzyme A